MTDVYPMPPSQPAQPSPGTKPAWYKRKGIQIAAAGVIGLAVGGAAGGSSASEDDDSATATPTAAAPSAPAPAPAATSSADRTALAASQKKVAELEKQLEELKSAPAVVSQAPPPAEAPAPAAGGLEDGSFTSTTPQLKDDGLGDFGGSARVTNTSDGEKTATFTYTIFKGSEQVGTASGVSNEVEPGRTVTVQLVSTDAYQRGPYRIEFQVDAEF